MIKLRSIIPNSRLEKASNPLRLLKRIIFLLD